MTGSELRAAVEAAGAVIVVLGIPFLVWAIRTISKISDDLQKVSHSVYGVDGANGLRGDVREASGRLDDHDAKLADHAIVLDRHTGRLDTHAQAIEHLRAAR